MKEEIWKVALVGYALVVSLVPPAPSLYTLVISLAGWLVTQVS